VVAAVVALVALVSVEAVALHESSLSDEVVADTAWVSVVVVALLVAAVVVDEELAAVCTARAPVMARNDPTLSAAAVVRAFCAGCGRFRRPVGGIGAAGVGEGASMGPTIHPEPGSSRRAGFDHPGSARRRSEWVRQEVRT